MFPFEQGAFEMVVIGALALIIVGPKDLPVLMRKVGQFTAKMRGMAAEFRASFDELARQSELDELRREVEALRTGVTLGPPETIAPSPFSLAGRLDGPPPEEPHEIAPAMMHGAPLQEALVPYGGELLPVEAPQTPASEAASEEPATKRRTRKAAVAPDAGADDAAAPPAPRRAPRPPRAPKPDGQEQAG